MSAAKKGASGGRLRVTLVRGWAGKTERQVRTLRGLGLRRSGRSNELPDVPTVRGAIEKVAHLLRVEPIQ
jgi:large subunit ribosomal protein L30